MQVKAEIKRVRVRLISGMLLTLSAARARINVGALVRRVALPALQLVAVALRACEPQKCTRARV